MASPAQITANQANSALSTGPRTPEGKAASSRNALTHGATSRQTVLPWEDHAQYDALLSDTLTHYAPHGEHEHALATHVAVTFWRYCRLLRIEAEFMSSADDNGQHPEAALANYFADPAGASKLRLILRYLANAGREWRAAISELRRVQKENRSENTCSDAQAAAFFDSPAFDFVLHRQPAAAEDNAASGPVDETTEPELATADDTEPTPAAAAGGVSRRQRRALEHARRKAEKKARRLTANQTEPACGFVSHLLPEAA